MKFGKLDTYKLFTRKTLVFEIWLEYDSILIQNLFFCFFSESSEFTV